ALRRGEGLADIVGRITHALDESLAPVDGPPSPCDVAQSGFDTGRASADAAPPSDGADLVDGADARPPRAAEGASSSNPGGEITERQAEDLLRRLPDLDADDVTQLLTRMLEER